MIPVVFDIETVAKEVSEEDEARFLDEWSAPGNWKDEDKIAAKRARDLKKWKKDRQFEVGGARPISVAFGEIGHGSAITIDCEAGDDEAKLAAWAGEWLNSLDCPFKFIGFNSGQFDIPILLSLLAKHGVTLNYKLGKWDSVDLLYFPLGRRGSLKTWCSVLGIEQADPTMHGGKVSELYEAGEWDKIKTYNKDDVRITAELYIKLSKIFNI